MEALLLGLLAALAWGLHDFSVRLIGGRAPVAAMLSVVLLVGSVALVPFVVAGGGFAGLNRETAALAIAAGLAFLIANFGLYNAFAIGPVRLVAPICGAYPVLSVAFAIGRGEAANALIWAGVLAVVAGIAIVARGEAPTGGSSEQKAAQASARLRAIGFAVLAGTGFAVAFALAQWAAESVGAAAVTFVGRIAALAVVSGIILARGVALLRPTADIWKPLCLMGALDVSALAFIAWAADLPRAEFASVASSVFGIVTILLAWRILGERLRPAQWAGVSTVFAGIAMLGLV
jgi:drug/metabolite transporter (DMT)-like permease